MVHNIGTQKTALQPIQPSAKLANGQQRFGMHEKKDFCQVLRQLTDSYRKQALIHGSNNKSF
jgi:hypothetical protein